MKFCLRKVFLSIITLFALSIIPGKSPAYALRYASGGDLVKWKESCFKYSVHEKGAPNVDFENLSQAIRLSFDAWEDADCSYFYFEETENASCTDIAFQEYAGNNNLIVFIDSEWEIEGNSNYSTGAIALTTISWDDLSGRILDANIEFNAEYFTFSTDNSFMNTDIQNTATHEIGHMLGIEHSDVIGATMTPTANYGEIEKRTLEQDDIDAVCELYPIEDNPGICRDPYCGLDLSCSSTNCQNTGINYYPPEDTNNGCSFVYVTRSEKNKATWFKMLSLLLLKIFL